MTALATHLNHEFVGLRRFDVKEDLDAVADLIDITFASEMAKVGGLGQDSIRSLSRYVPLIWATSLFSSQYLDVFAGFVWEVDGRIVGNVSISRVLADNKRWMIGNLAVHPDFRHQGIAKRLTWAALEFIRGKNGQWVVLDVRHDNEAAYSLYRGLGFRLIDSYTELRLDQVPDIAFVPSPGHIIRPRRPGDAQALYQLARAATAQEVLRVLPVRLADFRGSILSPISNAVRALVGMQVTKRFVLEVGKRIVATLEMSLNSGGVPDRFSLTVHPDFAGTVEDDLSRFALGRIGPKRHQMVIAEVSASNSPALQVLAALGFEEARVLHRLALEITHPPESAIEIHIRN